MENVIAAIKGGASPMELILIGLASVVLGLICARYYDQSWGTLLDALMWRRENHRLSDVMSRRISPGAFVLFGLAMIVIGIVRSG